MNNLNHLENLVRIWAQARGVYEHSTPQAQTLKAMSELGELTDNILKGRDVRDDIGDVIVCLINVAAMKETNLSECLHLAWNEIKDRKGRMVPGGAFVKEGDGD